jgi:HD-GYP domain-containing protein (c-di-GMP phosphodiesterase class II)
LDLDGFKFYNDSFGHYAGDSLLARLGQQLASAVTPAGVAFRLGGDEFCTLTRGHQPALELAAADALSEQGEAFHVTASYGTAVLPADTRSPSEALRLADQRMYRHKARGRPTAEAQSKDVLLRALAERHPALGHDLAGVAEHASAVAVLLGLDPESVRRVHLAAELHDVGKVAIPDAIINKPGRLDDQEWAFIWRHTIIGERIIGAAPALAAVAAIVRSTHERWDGGGYPDRLVGEEIPLASRIVAVCDAFDAMVSERPYAPARTRAAALDELRRCAATQFDPDVVAAFAVVLAHQAQPHATIRVA